MGLSSQELEALADHLLRNDFKDKKRNKSQSNDYPILSPSQIKRRRSMEIPYSNLSTKQRLDIKSKNWDFDKEVNE